MNLVILVALVIYLLELSVAQGVLPVKDKNKKHHKSREKPAFAMEGDERKVKWPEQKGKTFAETEVQIKADRPDLDVLQVPEGEFR